MALDEWADLKYLHGQSVAHVVPFGSPYALCQVREEDEGVNGSDWYGTGCFDEIEAAQAMPRCTTCAVRVGATHHHKEF